MTIDPETWSGTEMTLAPGPFAAIASAAVTHRERYASAATLAGLIENDADRALACGASDRDAWASEVRAMLARYGVEAAEAARLVVAAAACP